MLTNRAESLHISCWLWTDTAFFVDSASHFPLSDRRTRLTELPRSQSFGLLGYSEGDGGVGRWRFAPATGKKEKPMSVRMALAKLCACTCGGAIIGSGAMQITDVPKARAQEIGRAHV